MSVYPQPIRREPVPYSGSVQDGYTVLFGPNPLDPYLADAVVLFTDIEVTAVDPFVARSVIRNRVNALSPHSRANFPF